MVLVFNSRTVKEMNDATKNSILACGFPVEAYYDGMTALGPINKSSVGRFANINTLITKYNLPLPPSLYHEWIVDRCTGESKQDFREIIDGPPGAGKSMSGIYGCERYAIEAASRNGQAPKDYFGIDNCALLQDTDGVTHLMDELDKFQAVFIDDAGVSAGHHDFATSSNKNLAAIMQTCRTKRWYVVFTSPMNKFLDLSIRELVYAKSSVFKPCHSAGFNILKRKGIHIKVQGKKYQEYNPHFIFKETKVDLYAAFSPDMIDAYKGIVETYDKARDLAADALIHERAGRESDKKNGTTAREKKKAEAFKKHKDKVYELTHDSTGKWLDRRIVGFSTATGTYSMRKITSETGLSEHMINMMIAEMKQAEKK